MTLSILCVTKGEPAALPFLQEMADLASALGAQLVIGADGMAGYQRLVRYGLNAAVHAISSAGFLESVLDEMLDVCPGDYILRLDDDERVSPAMRAWLMSREYERGDHWAFPRANLWKTDSFFILNAPLWPDLQTRLSTREKAGGRTEIHAGSPFGTGRVAPVVIEHHKFLVKTVEERRRIVQGYEHAQRGAGSGHYLPFSVPEDYYERLGLVRLRDGDERAVNPEHLTWVTP